MSGPSSSSSPSPPFPSFTKTWHTESYPDISPSRPELSAAGKLVVITGGTRGIGASVTRAYAAAGCTRIVILARREADLVASKESIERDFPGTRVLGLPVDIADAKRVDEAFGEIASVFDAKIDVLVALSAYLPTPTPVLLLEDESNNNKGNSGNKGLDLDDWWKTFTVNVLGAVHTMRAFARHSAEGAAVLNVSSAMATIPPLEPGQSAYSASKAATGKVVDYMAFENPGLRFFNVHPGLVDTDMSRKSGHGGMDHVDLPGHFCLWLASPEAGFLNGKWVWVNWDVSELKARRDDIVKTDLLNTKIGGVSFDGVAIDVGDI